MKNVITMAAAGIVLAALAGCQTKQSPPAVGNASFAGLGGSYWQLVEFQSMDDAQGTKRPDDRAKYTIAFDNEGGEEGNVALRLDCNRGVGAWKNPIAHAMGGTLEFGPLGVTRALCPPPTMGEFLAQQLGYVRSFTIRDGRLYMALMADGGIIVWEPARAGK